MSSKVKKITKIIDEMASILLADSLSNLEVKISINEKDIEISFHHYHNNMTEQRLIEIEKTLNKPRRFELESYYWTLIGETDVDQSLQLIGGLIDSAVVKKIESDLYITLVRINE